VTTWEVASEVRSILAEAPMWDEDAQRLWYVDIEGHRAHGFDLDGPGVARDLGGVVGAVIPADDGDMLWALGHEIRKGAWDDPAPRVVASVPGAGDGTMRLNDAACDPRGRLWFDDMSPDFVPGSSSLYRLDADGPTRVMTGCELGNGMGWSPDGSTMYFVDSRARTVHALDYDVATGEASAPRAWLDVPELDGYADGLTVDAEGGVWIAMYLGSAVRRYAADGTLSEVVELPVSKPTSVCFGGPDLTDLYVTTSCWRLPPEELAAQPEAGRLLVVPGAGVGLPSARYAGR